MKPTTILEHLLSDAVVLTSRPVPLKLRLDSLESYTHDMKVINLLLKLW